MQVSRLGNPLVNEVVIPLALMTTYPAEALLGRLEWGTLVTSLIGTVVLATISRQIWLMSIRRYTSASS